MYFLLANIQRAVGWWGLGYVRTHHTRKSERRATGHIRHLYSVVISYSYNHNFVEKGEHTLQSIAISLLPSSQCRGFLPHAAWMLLKAFLSRTSSSRLCHCRRYSFTETPVSLLSSGLVESANFSMFCFHSSPRSRPHDPRGIDTSFDDTSIKPTVFKRSAKCRAILGSICLFSRAASITNVYR